MQFKYLSNKSKRFLFLFLLIAVGIGVFANINFGENRVKPKTPKPDYGLIDGGIYDSNFHGRVDVYENPFFGMKVNFPNGWVISDQREGTMLVPFEKNKDYLFKSYIESDYLLGVSAEKFKGGSKKFLENVMKTDYIHFIGPEINGRIVESPIQTTDIKNLRMNNLELKFFDALNMRDYYSSNYALELDDYIIHFQLRSIETKEETHMAFAELIKNISFE